MLEGEESFSHIDRGRKDRTDCVGQGGGTQFVGEAVSREHIHDPRGKEQPIGGRCVAYLNVT